MIYLIDDNRHNQHISNYGIHYIKNNDFSDILIYIDKLEKNQDLSFLTEASCILIHSTTADVLNGEFIDGSKSNVIKIMDTICENGDKIPLVTFSEGNTKPNLEPISNKRIDLKKSLFYSNLYDFLIHYRENKEFEFEILLNGKHYKSIKIVRKSNLLIEMLQFKDQNEILKLRDINLTAFKEIIEMASISVSFDELLESLEDNPITVLKFIDNLNTINNSFTKYGKNIYGWL
jgi:hypothetical protein